MASRPRRIIVRHETAAANTPLSRVAPSLFHGGTLSIGTPAQNTEAVYDTSADRRRFPAATLICQRRMMRKTPRITSLSAAESLLIMEAIATLAVASLMVAFAPFGRVAKLARHPENPPPTLSEQVRHIRAVRRAVAACAHRVPWRAKCIEQGFAAHWMLRRRSIGTVLHYGVARRDTGLIAHVWVRSGSTDVIGCENLADFAEVARFPPSAKA